MKKIILYIGSVVFTALMVYNIGAGNLIAKNTDVSLESIKIMAVAAQTELPEVTITCSAQPVEPGNCWLNIGSPVYKQCVFTGWIVTQCYY